MKLFPIIAAFALHAAVVLGEESNTELVSDSQSGSTSIESFFASHGINFTWVDSLPASESDSMTDSASGSAPMSFESFTDLAAHIISEAETWSADKTKTMTDWVKPSSVEFTKFQKKMDAIDALLVEMKRLPDSVESLFDLEPMKAKLTKKMDEITAFVKDCVETSSAKMADAGSLTIDKLLNMLAIADLGLDSASGSTEESDESLITQMSVDSATQLSPTSRKTESKLTESVPVGKSIK